LYGKREKKKNPKILNDKKVSRDTVSMRQNIFCHAVECSEAFGMFTDDLSQPELP
jgi:hypothetical protein